MSGLFEDKDFDFFALSAGDPPGDGFFDSHFFGTLDSIGSSDTSNDTSNESAFFDELSLGSAASDAESRALVSGAPPAQAQPRRPPTAAAAATAAASWRWAPVRQGPPGPPPPPSQKVLHRLRHDGVGISSSQLLALEGKPTDPGAAAVRSATPPQTPPSTPFSTSGRTSATPTPAFGAGRNRTPRTLRRTATGSPAMVGAPAAASGQPPSAKHHHQRSRTAEWSEAFQSFSLRDPAAAFPLSPPHSGRLAQQPPARSTIPSNQDDDDDDDDDDDVFGPPALGAEAVDSAGSSNQSASTTSGGGSGGGHTFALPDRTLSLHPSPPTGFAFGPGDPWDAAHGNGFGPPSALDDAMGGGGVVRPDHIFDASLDPALAVSGLMISYGSFDSLGGDSGSGSGVGDAGDGAGFSFAEALAATGHDADFGDRAPPPPPPPPPPPADAGPPARRRSSRPAPLTPTARTHPRPRSPSTPGLAGSPFRAAATAGMPHHHPHHPPPRRQKSTPCFASAGAGGGGPRISRTPRTPRTPKTPKTAAADGPPGTSTGGGARHNRTASAGGGGGTGGGGGARGAGGGAFGGFVNYTPDDSGKILSGVAPSGSSKTKARREREASERSRKMSEMAARAIREVGGETALERFRRETLMGDEGP